MGTAERRQREKGQRRRQIVEAARALFRDRGYEGSTMPDIAAAAELATGTLYLYFPSKQALYAELLHEGYALLERRLRTAVSRVAAPRARAEALVDAFLAFAREHPDSFDILFFILREHGRGVSELRRGEDFLRRLAAGQDACKQIATEVLGACLPDLPAGEVTRRVEAVWSMLAGVVLYFRRDETEVFVPTAQAARRVILDGALREV
jgi:AcrR family transcriptional regulator